MPATIVFDNTQRLTMQAALASLVEHCDGATRPDREGFNKADAYVGHLLAETPTEDWNPSEAIFAAILCRRYRRQLTAYGIPTQELPALPEEVEKAIRARARAKAKAQREKDRAWAAARAAEEARAVREAQEAQRRLEAAERAGLRWDNGLQLLTLTTTGFNALYTAAAQGIPTRRWNGLASYDTFMATELQAVELLAAQFGVPVRLTTEDRASIDALLAAMRTAPPVYHVAVEGRRVTFRFPYSTATISVLKAAGARWEPSGKYWWLSVQRLPDALEAARTAQLNITPELEARVTAMPAAAPAAAPAQVQRRAGVRQPPARRVQNVWGDYGPTTCWECLSEEKMRGEPCPCCGQT